jgi:hypothetical protein
MLSRALKQVASSSRTAIKAIPTLSRASSSSSSAPSRSENHQTLDRETKRTLISLYHQCDSFITPENLSAHIDAEFARSQAGIYSGEGYSSLKGGLGERQMLPKMTTVNSSERDEKSAASMLDGMIWSGTQSERSMAVKAALYGVDGSLRAGLETVEEYRKTLPPRTNTKKSFKKRS